MEIINYDKDKQRLSVRYNTKVIWTYYPISEEMFKLIAESTNDEKTMKNMIHSYGIVGISKEDK